METKSSSAPSLHEAAAKIRLLVFDMEEYGVPDLTDPGYGDTAVRVEVALLLTTVALVDPKSTLDAEAGGGVEVEPRGSLPCVAWKRATVLFTALAGVDPLRLGVSGSGITAATGVGGGDINATFLCCSEVVIVPVLVSMLSVVVWCDGVRATESGMGRGDVVRVAILNASLLS